MKYVLYYNVCCILYKYIHCFDVNEREYVNIHCRDNEDVPVDWWFVYKPPSKELYRGLGRNFTYITSNEPVRWRPSQPDTTINDNSLLQFTLSSVFKPTYTDHIAFAIYDGQKGKNNLGSPSRGILIADEIGGVWIGHTVPDLINLKRDRPLLRVKENTKGHSFACLSVDLTTINHIARYLRHTSPYYSYVRIPKTLNQVLPEWNFQAPSFYPGRLKPLSFVTADKTLHAELHVKAPGDKYCLYRSFAISKKIVLDVYGQTENDFITIICGKSYGIRNIESISLKISDHVYYFNNMTDRLKFAVSTAAHWQTLGSGPTQYWTCLSDLDKENSSGIGGHLLCIDSYKVWLTYDNLKIKEPQC